MNTLRDLTDALEQQASRGTPRGAEEVLAAARDGAPSTARRDRRVQPVVATVAVVGVCLGVGLSVLLSRTDDSSLATTTTPELPSELAPLTVEGGTVAVVGTGFDRVWVATRDSDLLPAESHLRSFDPATGEQLSETTLIGDPYQFALTGRYLWVRASTGGPASFPVGVGGLGDNAIYRVDPTSGEATPMRYLNGDGPLVGTESRIAAADASHIEIVDEDGQEIASATIDEAAGVPDATFPGTNAIHGLAFAEGGDAPPGIYAVHDGRRELLQLDPTGRHMATIELADAADRVGPQIATAGDRVVIQGQPTGLIQVTVPLVAESEPSVVATPVPSAQMHPLDDHQLLLGGGGMAAVIDLDSGGVTTTPLDSGDQVQLLVVDGRAWAAQWSAPEGATTSISFTSIEKPERSPLQEEEADPNGGLPTIPPTSAGTPMATSSVPGGVRASNGPLALEAPPGWSLAGPEAFNLIETQPVGIAAATFDLAAMEVNRNCTPPVGALAEIGESGAFFAVVRAHPVAGYPDRVPDPETMVPVDAVGSSFFVCDVASSDALYWEDGFRLEGVPYGIHVFLGPAASDQTRQDLASVIGSFVDETW